MKTTDWPPQMCEVESGEAVYLNRSTMLPISHPKHAHFKTLPAVETSVPQTGDSITTKTPVIGRGPASPESLVADIKINEKLLNKNQLAT